MSAAVLGGGLLLWLRFAPLPDGLLDPGRFVSTTIVDRNGVVLSEPLSATGHRSEWLKADALPPRVVEATISAEDARFFEHPGVDPLAVVRATIRNVTRGRVVEGGSTITQQVAKLLLGSRGRTFAQKGREAVLALRLEQRLTKREILALYLNLAPYGNQTMGIARASRRYFGCVPEDLTIAQAAYLAALPQRPTAFNPLRDPQRAVARQRYVLARMAKADFIAPLQLAAARNERLRFDRGSHEALAQHFVEQICGTGRIETTLDAALQREVAGIISANRASLIKHGAHSVAVVVLDNAKGEWLAWEGSGDYFGDDFGGAIDGVVALRQPGSTLKPFTYALAFESGLNPATVIADIPSHFPTAESGVVYTPRNYDGKYRGPLRARLALAGSENVPAVALLSQLGPETLLRFLRNAGFTDLQKTADYYGLGLTLGDAEVRLAQLVAAYSTFARGGTFLAPRMLRGQRTTGNGQRLFSEKTAFWITDILSDPEAREFIFGEGGSLSFPFPVAVKTGTSQAYRDNWTIGYTREVTVGVWVGNFDREELRNSTGVTGAAPIFNSVMMAAVTRARGGAAVIGDSMPILAPPPGLVRERVCALSGLHPTPNCPTTTTEWLAADAPAQLCTWHRPNEVQWPAEYHAWARTHAPASVRPPTTAAPTRVAAALRVVNPPNGATFLIDPTLRSEFQTLRLRAVAQAPVTWHVDDRRVSVEWPLSRGEHTITAIDAEGRRDSVRIWVK